MYFIVCVRSVYENVLQFYRSVVQTCSLLRHVGVISTRPRPILARVAPYKHTLSLGQRPYVPLRGMYKAYIQTHAPHKRTRYDAQDAPRRLNDTPRRFNTLPTTQQDGPRRPKDTDTTNL